MVFLLLETSSEPELFVSRRLFEGLSCFAEAMFGTSNGRSKQFGRWYVTFLRMINFTACNFLTLMFDLVHIHKIMSPDSYMLLDHLQTCGCSFYLLFLHPRLAFVISNHSALSNRPVVAFADLLHHLATHPHPPSVGRWQIWPSATEQRQSSCGQIQSQIQSQRQIVHRDWSSAWYEYCMASWGTSKQRMQILHLWLTTKCPYHIENRYDPWHCHPPWQRPEKILCGFQVVSSPLMDVFTSCLLPLDVFWSLILTMRRFPLLGPWFYPICVKLCFKCLSSNGPTHVYDVHVLLFYVL